jgi:hypothetical protein
LLYTKCTPSEESDHQELKNKMTKTLSDVTKMGKVAGSHVAKVLQGWWAYNLVALEGRGSRAGGLRIDLQALKYSDSNHFPPSGYGSLPPP